MKVMLICSKAFYDKLNYFKDKFNLEEIHGGIRQKGVVLDEIMRKYSEYILWAKYL